MDIKYFILFFVFIIFIIIVFGTLYLLLLRNFKSIKFENVNKKINYNEKIDAVYTWVNGKDKTWIENRKIYKTKESSDRYNVDFENSELLLSIRSLYKFVPWINKIFIVVMRPQNPRLPKELMKKVTIIYHDEIWEDISSLPVFNSHAIESQLHRIPNLSEKFIYLNDDIYFTDYIYPYHYFHNNLPIYRGYVLPFKLNNIFIPKKNKNYFYPIYNLGQIYLKKNIFIFRYHHFSVPLLKSNMIFAEKSAELKRIWSQTSKSKFRSITDIPPIHACVLWSLINKKALVVTEIEKYWKGIFICKSKGIFQGMCDYNRVPNSFGTKKPNEICVNDPVLFKKFKKYMDYKVLCK